MENYYINCNCKLTAMNKTKPLWNQTTEKLCSDCRKKADFFLSTVTSQASAVGYFNYSVPKLLESGFWPNGMQYLEHYCRNLDNPPVTNSVPEKSSKPVKSDRKPDVKSKLSSNNIIASIFIAASALVFVAGFICGIALGKVQVLGGFYNTVIGTTFSFKAALPYWAVSFFIGMVFIGFAEIIKLLQKISDKKG